MSAITDMIDRAPDAADRLDLDLAKLPRNDYGNAMRLLRREGDNLLFVDEIGAHVWDGRRWSAEGGEYRAMQLAHKVAEKIRAEADALQREYDSIILMPKKDRPPGFDREAYLERIQKHYSFATASGNTAKVEAMLRAVIPYKRVRPDQLNADIWLLNVRNGTLELKVETGDSMPQVRLREHRREDLITLLADVDYDPQAQAPLFDRFIRRIQPIDAVRTFVQTYLGLALTGDVSEQKMAIFFGVGSNGKSVLVDTMNHMLDDYAVTVPVQTFMYDDRRSGAQASPDIARMAHMRFVMASEPEVGSRLSESVVKRVTGGEEMEARHLNKGFFDFMPRFKMVLSVNIRPQIQGQDHGIWRRVNLVPFEVVIPKPEVDKTLPKRLRAEYSGILNWLLEGLGFWFADNGLVIPEEVTLATENYRSRAQPVNTFIADAINRKAGEHVGATRLYELYKEWCQANAEDPVTQTKFGRLLDDMGFKKVKAGNVFYADMELKVRTFKADSSEGDGADESGEGGDPRPEPPPNSG
jgi:putative DNA primase/helicase